MLPALLLLKTMRLRSLTTLLLATVTISAQGAERPATWRVGLGVADLTPPVGFPMAGYYHERLADATLDPLQAKAIVFQDGSTSAALVVCDLIGIATDLSREVRRRASEQTGIPADHIVIAATHTHTAPDYMRELYLFLGNEPQDPLRADYIRKLIEGPVEAIARAQAKAAPAALSAGYVRQETPLSFNRRAVMRDGSVRTWQRVSHPDYVRPAGPIDPQIGLLVVNDLESARPRGIVSNFALHLDTVGGTQWSADYPFFLEQSLHETLGGELVSLFATGCCGDINHVDPAQPQRNTASQIGRALGESLREELSGLPAASNGPLQVRSEFVALPLQEATREEVERAVQVVRIARAGGKPEFFEHVTAYKKLIIDQFRNTPSFASTPDEITWGLSRSLTGVGETLPVRVTVLAIGGDVAIVCLPGEVFVDLGLAIKQASPYRTTLVVELSDAVETIYIPHRAAFAGGSYEVTNSTLQPGSGEVLVETALTLLRQTASATAEFAQ